MIRHLDRHSDLLKPARIIWVDDHSENNRAVVSILRQYDAYVDTPTSNQEVFGVLERAEYDVIVTDVGRDSEGENSKLKGVELANELFRRWGQ